MSVFNRASRTKNAMKTSVAGVAVNLCKILLGFGYRSLFLMILSETYLGINGLFTSILQVLSLAELGISTAIVYRFYDPINREDVQYVGMLMNFFRRVYGVIAGVILALGLAVMPFIHLLIRNASEVPPDVNLYVVYLLFLLNTLSTYLFTYKLTLLTADQRNYWFSLADLAATLARYVSQIVVLLLTRNFTLTLGVGIGLVLLVNYAFSRWVTAQYRPVFRVREMLPKEERGRIYRDTRAVMYHKVGATVLVSTDNAVLTRMVSLAATGIYSNYAMILQYIQILIGQFLGNFTPSVGNARQNMTREAYYALFRKMVFLGLWVASVVTVCCYAAIDDLIAVWLGPKYMFQGWTTPVLCLQLFMTVSRSVNGAFITADGLFVKDRIRPLIESALNLGISIVLTRWLGITGVFLGTVISTGLTAQWREPLLMYRFAFRRRVREYWFRYGAFAALTLALSAGVGFLKSRLAWTPGWALLLAETAAAFLLVNGVLILLFRRAEEYQYLKQLAGRGLARLRRSGGGIPR
ncbi:MAG: hypothetical protein E7325_05115 [Clostridiales bacterium]|nr:hypothetical protein [Clostridiales bacterium]